MSNTQVGAVYQQIIADVVESSRVDFEEGGVDEHVLEELKRGWQQKLSQLQVAAFPWDPKVEPQPTVANPPTIPSNAGNFQTPPSMGQGQGQGQIQQANIVPNPPHAPQMNQNGGPRIKQEPGLDNSGGMSQAPYQPPLSAGTTAVQRAAANLNATYGSRAAASISSIHAGAPQQGQYQPTVQQYQAQQQAMHNQQRLQMQQHTQRPNAVQQPQHAPLGNDQYKPNMLMPGQPGQQGQRPQNQNSLNSAQTDGANDEFEGPVAILKSVNENGEQELGRMEVDGLIRDKITAMGQAMEGGGLMLPLREASNSKKRQRKVKKSASGTVPQHDGNGSDDEDNKDNVKGEEHDEDAINSDLDDSDEGNNEEDDDDDGMGHFMLCMYDKVQRVKNKWKCVMKDGVLTANGKEYVFHKASGEYEW